MSDLILPDDIILLRQKLLSCEGTINSELISALFEYQSENNPIYKQFLKGLKFDLNRPDINEIPFLPISTFKNFDVTAGMIDRKITFKSSSTTGMGRSNHHVHDPGIYHQNSKKIFEDRFGKLNNKLVLALLPGYIERGDSSLVYMVNHFMHESGQSISGFYLDHYQQLAELIAANSDKDIILFGVPYAFIKCMEETAKMQWTNVTIIETGGMKGKGKEIPRKEFHGKLKAHFNPHSIQSEYGMTELLSQAYTGKNGLFQEHDSLRILVRELNDPFQNQKYGKPGVLNVLDLANIHSCAFIETEDMAVSHGVEGFEVIGRVDNREIRGCNMLA